MAGTQNLQVLWDLDGSRTVASVDELDALLDGLHERFASEGRQVLVLVEREGRPGSLGVGLGGAMSMLSWLDLDHGEDVVSLGGGQADGGGYVAFEYAGQASEYPRSVLVPLPVAREAVRRFAATGQRPGSVRWQQA